MSKMNYDTNFSNFAIKEHNKSNYNPDFKYMDQLLDLQALGFSNGVPHDLFCESVVKHTDSFKYGERWQELFLVETSTDKVVASFKILIKPTDQSDTFNCVVTWVTTHPDYRKRGLMEYLLSECMKKYEDHSYRFSGSDENDEDGVDEYLKREVSPDCVYYWTLYSAVKEYYSRFGFKPIKIMNWLDSPPIETSPEFQLSNCEAFLTADEAEAKLCNISSLEDYVLKIEPHHRSTSLKTPSFFRLLISRDAFFFGFFDLAGDNYGLSIKNERNDNEETCVIIATHSHLKTSVIGRLYTNVVDQSTLIEHLNRVVEFVYWHNRNYLAKLPFVDSTVAGKVEFCTDDIFVGTGSDIPTKKLIINWFKDEKGWTYDDSNDRCLPMLKEFGKIGVQDGLEWVHNGMWCFD